MNGEDTGRAAAAGLALTVAERGGRLLTGYLLLAVAVLAVATVTGRYFGAAWLAALGAGVALLIAVSAANVRARKPLRARWPELARVPGAIQPSAAAGGAFYIFGLIAIAAVAIVGNVVHASAAATATTEVSVGACSLSSRGHEEICAASWQADGHTYHGDITWSPGPAKTLRGRYDPAHPGTIYSRYLPFLTRASGIAGVVAVVAVPVSLYGLRKYRRECRRPYLAALRAAAGAAGPPPPVS